VIKLYAQKVALPLVIGAIGGGIFHVLHLPAAWLSGGVIAITIAALAGVPTSFPKPVRAVTFLFLGLIMGSGVTPETVSRMGQWPLSLMLLSATMAAISIAVMFYLQKTGQNRETAFFASIPGALSYVLALAAGYNSVNQRYVALFQSVRLLALVVVLPSVLAIAGLSGKDPVKLLLSLRDMAILITAGTLCGWLFEKMKIPSGLLIGAMVMSALLYGSGIIKGEFYAPLQAFCFLLMALLIGDRFAGTTMKELRVILKTCLIGFAISLVVAVMGSVMSAAILKLPLGQVLLAFAPGGIEGMIILSFLFDLDPAYVGAHHLARFLGIALVLPFVVKYLKI
jgi:uncharacterized protein